MTYREMLQSPFWKAKREEILIRERHTCQRFGSSPDNRIPSFRAELDASEVEILEGIENRDFNLSLVRLLTVDGIELYLKCKSSKEILSSKSTLLITVNFVKQDTIIYPFNGSNINNIGSDFLIECSSNHKFCDDLKPYISYKIDFDILDVDREGFWIIEEQDESEYIKSENLHVHHTCYRKGIQMWGQENEDYQVLCNVCHRIVHDNQLIPFYNERGEIYQYMKPCTKCGGQGYLDCYHYIDNGICFKCEGKGYV